MLVWNDLRTGIIDLRPLNRTLRLLTLIGFGLTLVFLFSMLFSDILRQSGARLPLPALAGDARPYQVPAPAVPLTLMALVLGWSYTLTGALHARPLARWGALLAFILVAGTNFATGNGYSLTLANWGIGVWMVMAEGTAWLGLLACFILLPRRKLPPALQFTIVTTLVSGLFLVTLLGAVILESRTGVVYVTRVLANQTISTFLIIIPLLVYAGLEMVDFALAVTHWTVGTVTRLVTGRLLIGVLLLVLIARLAGLATVIVDAGPVLQPWLARAGAAVFCGGLALIGLWRRWQPVGSPVPLPAIFAMAFLVVFLLRIPILYGGSFMVPILLSLYQSIEAAERGDQYLAAISTLSQLEVQYRPLIVVGVGLLVAWLARRRTPSLATFGLILAWGALLSWLTSDGQPLVALRFGPGHVDTVLLFGFTALTGYWLVRRTLTQQRTLGLLAAALLMWLLTQTDFLDNPFSPLFQFAGGAFLVFAIFWGVLTGGSFVNSDSPAFPRTGRLLIYLGYVLLTVAVTHWYVISHDIIQQSVQNLWTMGEGFVTYGLPLAYLALVEGCGRLLEAEQES
jgi:hypothetical protein